MRVQPLLFLRMQGPEFLAPLISPNIVGSSPAHKIKSSLPLQRLRVLACMALYVVDNLAPNTYQIYIIYEIVAHRIDPIRIRTHSKGP